MFGIFKFFAKICIFFVLLLVVVVFVSAYLGGIL